eukprot:m.312331 g.312331  ORF g.312331 m.312331 type:complete len:83 (+) comp252579_c0_seq1:935-1183(+)
MRRSRGRIIRLDNVGVGGTITPPFPFKCALTSAFFDVFSAKVRARQAANYGPAVSDWCETADKRELRSGIRGGWANKGNDIA